jgi:hypothetical protein
MIRVTIEMVPQGDDERAFTMAQGVIINDGSETGAIGNYAYGLTRQTNIPGRDPGIGHKGEINDFPRARRNVWHLLKAVLEDALS